MSRVERLRLFVAFDISEAVRENIGALIAKLRPAGNARWMRAEAAHVTLKFIGETPSENVANIQTALGTVSFPSPITMNFRGLGFFPNPRRPSVLWAGVDAGPDLSALATAVDAALEPLGVARDLRKFSPHLTVARFKSTEGLDSLRAAIAAAKLVEFGETQAREFHLYRSILKPSGAEYTRLASFPCSG